MPDTDDEWRYECLYCDEPLVGRAMRNHVLWSDDTAHGPRGEIPADYAREKCNRVERYSKTVLRDGPIKQHDRYICLHCGAPCRGRSGLGTHINREHSNRASGRLHDVDTIDYDLHMRFPADSTKRIRVPTEDYAGYIELTDEEKADGWDITVDESLQDVLDITVYDNDQDLLEDIRKEFYAYLTETEENDDEQ